ncbi:hypothetical protein [Gandjariella thermophila]|uniref:Uncharacterized protein n=1 Tax=Gandjariella thermophila TaxID=1931992 RepID=A0A4D4JAF4_9PSEU|nr:hypothetical protein [Gandjariella thermophila]GDY31990.1 hypothetical protein GTS_36230 [Gandjariella thermophila]
MTIDVPIRPGAALNDPETRRFVEDNIINAKYNWIMRHSYIPDRAYNKEGIVNILANYPWQEYGYKYGRWQRELFFDELPFIPLRTWEKKYQTLLLIDPRDGSPVEEVNGMAKSVEPPSGRLLFAGDPHLAGVISTMRDGKRNISIVGSTRLGNPEGDQQIGARARDLTKVMVPEHAPQVQLFNPPKEYVKYLGPWLADHPEKPSNRL